MPMVGMDVEQVQQLAAEMTRSAEETQQIEQRVTAAVQGAQWIGVDHDQFVQAWEQHRAQLTQIAQLLRDAATSATRNAEQQATTSGQ